MLAAKRLATTLIIFLVSWALVFSARKIHGSFGFTDLVQGKPIALQAAMASGGGFTLGSDSLPASSTTLLRQLSGEITQLTDLVNRSLVSIAVRHREIDQEPVIGSGVFISKEGHILTAWSLLQRRGISGAIEVSDQTGRHTAQLIGAAPRDGIAVLQIKRVHPSPALAFGDSTALKDGEMIFSFAPSETTEEQNLVSQGIINARERWFSDHAPVRLHTNAPRAGAPGRPLVNLSGQLVGLGVSHPQVTSTQAVPISFVRDAIQKILNGTTVHNGYVGIECTDLTGYRFKVWDFGGENGCVIDNIVRNSPAAAAGLRADDVILRFNGRPTESSQKLIRTIWNTEPGTSANITLWRNGEELQRSIEVASRPLL
ncbi:MAG: S1C family serine protease [Verrucomicrobiota bacterium]